MAIQCVNLIYFSPTKTTKKTLEKIAQGIQAESIQHYDLTLPNAAAGAPVTLNKELSIFGVPVYAGRVPVTAVERLKRFKGDNTPAVIVVVYGNRDFDDALLELKNLTLEAGFKPVAGGAFIGEHSYSTSSFPVAQDRPDTQDDTQAMSFGEKILEKLQSQTNIADFPLVEVPGNFPYMKRSSMGPITPVTFNDVCTLCGTCASECPTGAITVTDEVVTDAEKCIPCCACVKSCPSDARVMNDPIIESISQFLNENFSQRKEPEIFM